MEAMKEKNAKKAQELANMHMINAYENMIKNGYFDNYEDN